MNKNTRHACMFLVVSIDAIVHCVLYKSVQLHVLFMLS